MKHMIKLRFALLAVTIFLTAILSAGCSDRQGKTVLTISAAASLKDAMNDIFKLYIDIEPDVELVGNFASSGTLQQQIEQGADVDLFLSAGSRQMDALADKNLIVASTRLDLVANELVLIAATSSDEIQDFDDLAGPAVEFLAIGNPGSVPAGLYAQESLTSLGLADAVKHKLVLAKDVREALAWVENGQAQAGLVYQSDAAGSDSIRIVCIAPEASHQPILYPAAVVAASDNQVAATDFLAFLSGEACAVVFDLYGFSAAGGH